MQRSPCGWLLLSPTIERTRQMSSATEPMCGNNSESSMPHSPCLRKRKAEPISRLAWLPGWKLSTCCGWLLPAAFLQLGLGIEQIDLARPAVLHEQNDRLGPGREMAGPRREISAPGLLLFRIAIRANRRLPEQVRQRQRPKPQSGPLRETSVGKRRVRSSIRS